MRHILWFVLLIASFSTFGSGSYKGLEKVYASMLMTKSSDQVKAAASYLYNSPTKSSEILDLAATVLYHQRQTAEINDDTLAWLAKLLGDSKNYRYSELLLSCTKNSKFPKLKKYAKAGYKALTKSDVAIFSSSKIDLLQVAQDINSSASTPNLEGFKSLTVSELAIRAIEEAGFPDRITIEYVSKHQPFLGRISHPHIALVYTNIGKIRLDHPGDKGTPVVIGRIDTAYQFGDSDYLASLAETDAGRIRYTAKRMYQAHVSDPKLLDRSVQYINDNISKKDKLTVDAMSWLCRVIGQSGHADYRPKLLHIAKNAKSSKLRKYAKKAASFLPH